MLKQVLGSRVIPLTQYARYRKINSFLCHREAVNENVHGEYTKQIQTVASKYNLSVRQFVEAISIYSLAQLSGAQHNFVNFHLYRAHQAKLFEVYQTNSFCGLGSSLEYPEIVALSKPSSEKQQALAELESVFLTNGPNVFNFSNPGYGDQFVKQFNNNIETLCQHYEKTYGADVAKNLRIQLEQVLEEFVSQKGIQFGLLKSIVERGLDKSLQATSENTEVILETKNQFHKDIEQLYQGKFHEDDLKYALDVDGHDRQALDEEIYQREWSQSKAQNQFNEQGQKIIYDTVTPDFHVFRYQVLAAVFGLTFLYLLYRGDAKYKTIVTVPALAYGFYTLSKHNLARRNIPYVKQILLNNNNSLEILIERNRVISKIQDVAENNFKVHYNSRKFFVLPFGSGHSDGYKCTINEQPAIIPFNYTGNGRDFNRLLNNQA